MEYIQQQYSCKIPTNVGIDILVNEKISYALKLNLKHQFRLNGSEFGNVIFLGFNEVGN